MRKKMTFERRVAKRLDDLYNMNHSLMVQLLEMERKMVVKQQRYLAFDECVPPAHICKSIMSMMNGVTTYSGFIGKLAEYYGCSTIKLLVDKNKCKKEWNAVYYSDLKKVFTYEDTISHRTVLHEWFHHMVNEKVVYLGTITSEKEEEFAVKFSCIFMERASS